MLFRSWGSSLELTRELYAVRLSGDGKTLLERQAWNGAALAAGWRLEQGWSPATRGPSAVLRDEAPYLTQIVDGRAVVLDYGIRQADGRWKLASDPSVSYASKAAITALGQMLSTTPDQDRRTTAENRDIAYPGYCRRKACLEQPFCWASEKYGNHQNRGNAPCLEQGILCNTSNLIEVGFAA